MIRAFRRGRLEVLILSAALAALLCVAGLGSAAQSGNGDGGTERRKVRQAAALLYKQAEDRVRQKKFEDARSLLTKSLAKNPDSGVFTSGFLTEPYYPHYLLGLIHMELEEYEEAIQEFLEEERQGQIQRAPELFETLTLQLAKAKQTDNQAPVIKVVEVEIVETRLEDDRETADVRFHGVIVDPGGIGSLSIAGKEINFKQSDDGVSFDDTLRLDPLPLSVQLVALDVTGNKTEQEIAVDLPPLDLGPAASGVHALLVGVDHYVRGEGIKQGDCPAEANTCGDPSKFVCYNLMDLKAAANDARRFYDFLIRRGVPKENVQLLISSGDQMDATAANVRAALDRLREDAGDKAIFYFAGHGVNSRRHKNLMLVSDTAGWECEDTPTGEATDLEASAIGVDTVEEALMQGTFDERYVIIDACRSSRLANTRSTEVAQSPTGFQSRGVGVTRDPSAAPTTGQEPVLFYATFDKSVSVEWSKKQAGYFTWYLLQGLRKDLSLWDLKSYVQESVERRTTEDHGVTQKPHVVLPDALENDYDLQKSTSLLGRLDR